MRWGQRVKAVLGQTQVLDGISQVAVEWMRRHIDESHGRGPNGGRVDHAPLKGVRGTLWSPKRIKGARTIGKRTDIVVVNGKARRKTMYKVEFSSYRIGGHPLRDTGEMYRSLSAKGRYANNRITVTLNGLQHALYQDRGFQTKGPNYLPITMAGRRGHSTGANPATEGLERGRDFVMRWKGVKVPARPFLLPLREDVRTLGRSIYLGLRAVLKGN